jgi:hypothetical protein
MVRHKSLRQTPYQETSSGEILTIFADTLLSHSDILGMNRPTAAEWALILLRDLRFGIPTDELAGEGFPFHDAEFDDPPLCESCNV